MSLARDTEQQVDRQQYQKAPQVSGQQTEISHSAWAPEPWHCFAGSPAVPELQVLGGVWALQREPKESFCLLSPLAVLDKIKSHICRIGGRIVSVCLPGYQDIAWWCSMHAAHGRASRYCIRDAFLLSTLPRCPWNTDTQENPLFVSWVQFVNFRLTHFCQRKLNL